MQRRHATLDGNEAAARVAFRINEVCAIYPITPASPMGELADAWAATGRPNLWGDVPQVVEMQSEAGAAGAVHGALQRGALATTFTASQGLLLMLPNMYKIAGELTPTVFHVAARTVATHALSIFGDHSDVMAARSTGFAMLAAGSVQECHDFALIAQAASLRSRVPFVHFFDGFRTSHEIGRIEVLDDEALRALVPDVLVRQHRERALSPERPVLRGSAQNPDVFFQAREAVNPFYDACPGVVRETMQHFARLVGRRYDLFDYVGHPEAERVLVLMGSGAETAHECVEHLVASGERVGLVKVRLFRPFDAEACIAALPASVRRIAVLDRTKEPGAPGEPLYLDVVAAIHGAGDGRFATPVEVRGGRYGLSSKEFTPAMAKATLDALQSDTAPRCFSVGIQDDVTHRSLPIEAGFVTEKDSTFRALFYGLGSDGTVGANKNSIKILGEHTDLHVQGYFVYDSKKAGSVTVSHLRFGKEPLRSSYLIDRAHFVACHHPGFLERFDILEHALEGGTFLLNSPLAPDRVWDTLPLEAQQHLIDKKLRFFVIDAFDVARRAGVGKRINTIMQTCFFALTDFLPEQEAIGHIKQAIEATYGRKGRAIVETNFAAVDGALAALYEVPVPASPTTERHLAPPVPGEAPEAVRTLIGPQLAGKGDTLPVSALPCDGTFPTGTSQWEKRGIALEIPIWDADLCVQCGKCAIVCPHAAIRSKIVPPEALSEAPAGFETRVVRGRDFKEIRADGLYRIQVAPDDCTGCGICVEVCPAKSKEEARRKAIQLEPYRDHVDVERRHFAYFLDLPEVDRRVVKRTSVRGSQLFQPLFEFSGACEGCGETPYLKLLSQLFGDRAVIANATGCSSIYGGNLPTTPWSQNRDGRGPAWSNSLFEDNAEFGVGFRIAVDQQIAAATRLLRRLADRVGDDLAEAILAADQSDEAGIHEQRERVALLRTRLEGLDLPEARALEDLAEVLVRRSIWLVGGDGWAYDIGFGGLDHVLASGRDVNVLVLDTEVYSNTGGQASKSTPRGAVAKFASAGKPLPKKDLALIAMTYGDVYVARVALGANDAQTIRAFLEAEAYPGPSLILAYSHCIAHGIRMRSAMEHHKLAVQTGHWPLLRFDPRRADGSPLQLDSKRPSLPLARYAEAETRFKMLQKAMPRRATELLRLAQEDVHKRWDLYAQLAAMHAGDEEAS